MKYKVFVLLLAVVAPYVSLAHEVNLALEGAPSSNVVWFYLKQGILHIVPFGADHILFVVALCLLNQRLKPILWQATAFTLAHSLTLALSMRGVVTLPAAVVEPVIALSIAFVAVENLVLREMKPWRTGIVFLFGLIHGLGFASVLNEIGLPPGRFSLSLLSFNLGVELGQVLVIAVVYGLLILPFGKRPLYRKALVYPLSVLIAVTALWWTFQRV